MSTTLDQLSKEDQAFCYELAKRTPFAFDAIAHLVWLGLDKDLITRCTEFLSSVGRPWDLDVVDLLIHYSITEHFTPRHEGRWRNPAAKPITSPTQLG